MIDMRKLNKDELLIIRKQVVRLKQQGRRGKEIEELTGVRQNRISEIWTAYEKGGMNGLVPQKSGRKAGEGMLLVPEEEKSIRKALIDKTPDQVKMAGCLWTRQKISEYIKRVYKKDVPLRSISNYLARWGLTCQRPTKRAYMQDDVRVRNFMENEYPAIAQKAKTEGAEIYWGDEVGVCNTENYERGFAPSGHPPVLKVETKRERVNMISAITNLGHARFMVYEGTMTQAKLLDFMKRLVVDAARKVFLILDNLRVHHGKIVAAWLAKNREKIEVFFLPPYSPEINPDEYLNHALKRDIHSGEHPRKKKDIVYRIHSFMRRLQHRKDSIRAFFNHPRLAFLLSYC